MRMLVSMIEKRSLKAEEKALIDRKAWSHKQHLKDHDHMKASISQK